MIGWFDQTAHRLAWFDPHAVGTTTWFDEELISLDALGAVIPTVNQASYIPTGPSFPGDYPGRD